jgi:putative transposase
MDTPSQVSITDRWARLRFSIIGQLLSSPPPPRELHDALCALATRTWQHPITDAPVRFGVSTLERWYYRARKASRDPVRELSRKRRSDSGIPSVLHARMGMLLREQFSAHPSWSIQLHKDNLAAIVRADPTLGTMPSYATVRRYMLTHGMFRKRRVRHADRPGAEQAATARERREVRSYEVTHVHGLWHLDFHVASRKVLVPDGRWIVPRLLGVIDDHSRLICHAQWSEHETAQDLCHALSQAIMKRGLPRALLTDNGAAMIAAETTEGLLALGIHADTTRAYSPEQNAKMEVFWAQLEGRLMALLEGHKDITLALLNEATLAWIEGEYHQRTHSEIDTTPLDRFLTAPSVSRPSPSSEVLQRAFRMTATRTQRRSDGTFTLDGVRFEVPSRYRHLRTLTLRYARWDLSCVDLFDPKTRTRLCSLFPLDKAHNADRLRRRLEPTLDASTPLPNPPTSGIAPRLRELMEQYAASGLPPAYIPSNLTRQSSRNDSVMTHHDLDITDPEEPQ